MLTEAVQQASSKWWTFLVRGIFALAIAAYAFAAPSGMASALVYVVAAYFIISGLAAILGGIAFTGNGHWWALILLGIVQAALGVLMLSQPGLGPLALAYMFAIWMIMSGTVELTAAIQLRNVISNEFWLGLLGVITLAAGFYVVLSPGIGLLALVYTVGIYGVLAGIALIGFAFRIKNFGSQLSHATA